MSGSDTWRLSCTQPPGAPISCSRLARHHPSTKAHPTLTRPRVRIWLAHSGRRGHWCGWRGWSDAGDVGGEELDAVSVEVAAGAVVVLGGSGVGVAGEDLGVAQRVRSSSKPGLGPA